MASIFVDQIKTLLADLQVNTKTITTTVPPNSEIVNVNLNTRTIELNQTSYSKFLSVAREHYAETIYFRVPRYFDGVDLSQTACVIEYINAANDSRIAPILLKDIISDPGYLIFGWCIHGDATRKAGTIKFAIRFYSINLDTKEFTYSLRTQMAQGKILYGMDEDAANAAAEEKDLFSKPIYDIVAAIQEASMIEWYIAKPQQEA